MASSSVDKIKIAVKEAKRIRRNLLRRTPTWTQGSTSALSGACGLASILLSIAVRNVKILRGGSNHIWTEVDGTIIDITATQFNFEEEEIVRGVLVTKIPRSYHEEVLYKGIDAYLEVVNHNWYDKRDHSKWDWISEYWL